MGQDRRQEGLGAYEAIKKINPETRIWVFSAFPEYEKLTKKLTKNLTGNEEDIFIEKTTNLKEDIRQKLVPKILECRFNCLIMEQEETCHQIEELEQAPEPNLDAYEQFKSDTEKIKQFEGKYIAFVDGKLVDSDNNKQNLLERLWQNYPNEPCFFKKVGEENRIIEIPYFDII